MAALSTSQIPQVAAQAHEVFGETRGHRARLFPRVAAQFFGTMFRCVPARSCAREIASDFRNALKFLARDQGLFQLLQVNGRAIIVVDVAQLVAGQNVNQHIAMRKTRQPLVQQAHARRHRGRIFLAGRVRIEQAPRVFGLVEKSPRRL